MTRHHHICIALGRFFANLVSAIIPIRSLRHRVRSVLDPLNPERVTRYLQRRYASADGYEAFLAMRRPAGHRPGNTIWQCWLQGEEQAPPIVKNCLSSVRRHKRPWQEVVLVTASNYHLYAEVPPHIVDKWKQGVISHTHFSDLLRVCLLSQHGGVWIDATCLLTAPIPDNLLQGDVFLYRSQGEFAFTQIQSCFICCKPDSYLMWRWRKAMFDYWQSEDRLLHYFVLHLMLVALSRSDSRIACALDDAPQQTDEAMHTLFYAAQRGEVFTPQLWQRATSASFIHKFTYKFPDSEMGREGSVPYVLSHQQM